MNVALFVTCLTDTFFPRVGEAVVRVLRHFDCTVDFPECQTCCGQPLFNSGFHRDAASLAQRLVDTFAPYEYVVTPSASCASMIKHHYADLPITDTAWHEAARGLAARTYEFSTFLSTVLQVNCADHVSFAEPVTMHYPCHARGIYSPSELAEWVGPDNCAQRRVSKRPDLCCGFGGSFSVDYAEISTAMLRDRLDDLTATGAELVVCNEGGCAMNLAGGAHRRQLPLRFKHIAECLAESLGLMEPQA